MDRAKLRETLEITSHVAVIAVAVAVLGILLHGYLTQAADNRLVARGLSKGAPFARISGLDYGDSDHTLVAVMSTTCPHCLEALPSINKLATDSHPSTSLQSAAVFGEDAATTQLFAHDHELAVRTIADVDLQGLGVPATPAIVVVDREGRIENFWIGEVPPEREHEISDFVNNSAS